jgi:hypothetical protein
MSEVRVPILRLLQGRIFEPEVVNAMVTAFEDALRELKLTNREDPIVERVAKIIIECAERGMRDPADIRDCALQAIRGAPSKFG